MCNKKTVGFQIRIMSNIINRYIESFQLHKEGNANITKVQGWIIDYIYDNSDKDIFQKDLENEFEMRRSTVTEMLKLMEKNGLIIRQSVPGDARLKKLVLTDKAIDGHHKIMGKIEIIESNMLEGIPKEKVEIFYEVLENIKQNIYEKGGCCNGKEACSKHQGV